MKLPLGVLSPRRRGEEEEEVEGEKIRKKAKPC
jgi:hypothetical protein